MASLKRDRAFQAIYRKGRWARSASLSLGILANGQQDKTRLGLRTRRGLKGSPQRNRLKRQLRGLLYQRQWPLRPGFDVIIVIHPTTNRIPTTRLAAELKTLCHRAGLLSSRAS